MRNLTLESLFSSPGGEIRLTEVFINLILAAVLAYLLKVVYTRFGTALSNRSSFSNNFLLLACTTTLVITVVKTSLALSLGLVGALSIVRFRSAIKEPEELTYLFLTIAVGLGFGAGQRGLTLGAFGIIVALILLRGFWGRPRGFENLHLTVRKAQEDGASLKSVVEALRSSCRSADLRRFEDGERGFEAAFLIGVDDSEQLEEVLKNLRALGEGVEISFVDSRGLL